MKLKQLLETIRKPTAKDKKSYKFSKSREGDGKLHYVVADEKHGNKILGYIDDEYIAKLSKRKGKDISPEAAAKIRLAQVEYFKNKKEN